MKHPEAFVQMNAEKRARADIDALLEENIPRAEEVLTCTGAKLTSITVKGLRV